MIEITFPFGNNAVYYSERQTYAHHQIRARRNLEDIISSYNQLQVERFAILHVAETDRITNPLNRQWPNCVIRGWAIWPFFREKIIFNLLWAPFVDKV